MIAGAHGSLGRPPAGDDGNVLVEFVAVAVLLLIPLLYLIVCLAQVQAAAFATEGAARDVARAYAVTLDESQAATTAAASVTLALEDQGLDPGAARVDVTCRPDACGTPGTQIVVRVATSVTLPGLAAIGLNRLALPVESVHRTTVDELRAQP